MPYWPLSSLTFSFLLFRNVIPFSESIEKMNASVFSNNSVLWHVAKRLRNEMGQPLPMASERQALLSFKASRYNNFSFLNEICEIILFSYSLV